MSHWTDENTRWMGEQKPLQEFFLEEVEAMPFFTKPFIIPVAGLVVGGIMMLMFKSKNVKDYGKLVLYFGAQSFMNVYMSWLFRKSVVAEAGEMMKENTPAEARITGIPAGFALTALQQVVSFAIFLTYYLATYSFPDYKYTLKPLNTNFDKFCVVVFGLVFCLNIALNNFSLSLISIAVNLIIRSCLPLTTFLSQQVLARCDLYPKKPCKALEISLMCVGVTCAGVFTWAKLQAKGSEAGQSSDQLTYLLGVFACLLSLLCGSLNLALAGVLGTSVHLNPMDTVAYMAIPATLFLTPVIFLLEKPVPGEWKTYWGEGKTAATDWEIMVAAWDICGRTGSSTFMYAILSGVFAFLYNVCQFTIVQTLSPSATAFGGNFNKAALIFLSLLTGLEEPAKEMKWNVVIWCAILGNIAAFSFYSQLQMKAKMEQHAELEDEEEESSSEDSSEEYA